MCVGLLMFEIGTRWTWVVNFTPRLLSPLCPRNRDAGCPSELVCTIRCPSQNITALEAYDQQTCYTPGCPHKCSVSWFRMWRPCMYLHLRGRRHFVGDRLMVFRGVIVVKWTVYSLVQFLGAFEKLREAIISFMSVRLSTWNNSAPTGRNLIKFDIWVFFENLSTKLNFRQNLTMTRTKINQQNAQINSGLIYYWSITPTCFGPSIEAIIREFENLESYKAIVLIC